MNLANIRQLLANRYEKVAEIGEQRVFRASRFHKGATVGIYYFDCSNALMSPEFDLGEYQERLLADDFYEQSGPLQWNLYLYFLCEDEDYTRLLEEGRVAEVESDGIYAKKYVTSEKLLMRELDLRTEKWHAAAKDLPRDISERWMAKLDAVGLSGAYMPDIDCTEVFRRYMKGQPITDAKRRDKPVASNAEVLPFISGMRLDDGFRPFPCQREFDLGACNLIEGVNGSGKTTMLEAIELWMCGRTKRNPKAGENPKDVALRFRGGDYLSGQRHGRNNIYRDRDLLWYGSHRSRGTDIYFRFNRFNFYNTDAATDIAHDSDANSIKNAVSDLVLGEQANIIEARLKTLLSYFKPAYASAKVEVERLLSQAADAEEDLKALAPDEEDTIKAIKRLRAELKRLGWSASEGVTDEVAADSFLHDVTSLYAEVEQCRKGLYWIANAPITAVGVERDRVNNLISNLERLSRQVRDLHGNAAVLAERINRLAENLALLDSWAPYLNNKDAFKLQGLNAAIESKRREVAAHSEAVEVLSGVKLEKYLESDESFAELEEREKKRVPELHALVNERRRILMTQEEQWGIINSLLAEIRSKSNELLANAPDLTNCPVCGAAYEVGLLAERLSSAGRGISQPQMMLDARQDLANAQRTLDEVDMRVGELQLLRYAASLTFDLAELEGKLTVSSLTQKLSGLAEALEQVKGELDDLVWVKVRLDREGLTETAYSSLKAAISEAFQDAPKTFEDSVRFDTFRASVKKLLEQAEADLKKAQEEITQASSKREQLLSEYFADSYHEAEVEAELSRRLSSLQSADSVLDAVQVKLNVLPNETLQGISVRLNEMKETYHNYKHTMKGHLESSRLRSKYEMRKREASEKLPDEKLKRDRAEKALETINSILDTDGKDVFLKDFLESNSKDIFEIYRLLHAPREFTDIDFGWSDGKIGLVRKANEKSSLTQISSGQRATLCLSIFLALNRKLKNGPPFLLFDDPVSLVDDLNALSFLDYLRDITITGARQVFFATANQKIASLFKKKFSQLEEEFKSISLSR